MRYLIATVFALLLIHTAAAISIDYSLSPEILLPGDYADCVLILKSTEKVEVNSVAIFGHGLEVSPSYFHVGEFSGEYRLPFSIKATKVGRFNVEVVVTTENETLTQNIVVVVDDRFPGIAISDPVYIGEVNEVTFVVSSPVELKNVRIEPLFAAVPRVLYLGSVNGVGEVKLKIKPDGGELKFKISFYNGRNYHELVRSVEVRALPSRGVVTSVEFEHPTLHLGDSSKLTVRVSNLRGDSVYDITIEVSGRFDVSKKTIPALKSGESAAVNFTFSAAVPGNETVDVVVKYRDEFGEVYEVRKGVQVRVLESYAIEITNVEVGGIGKVAVSGDVSNNGRSTAYNVYVYAACGGEGKEYFVGNVEPSDFQGFDIELKCNGSVTLKARWSNSVGDTFEVSKTVGFRGEEVKVGTDRTPLVISAAAVAVVAVIIAVIVYRYVR